YPERLPDQCLRLLNDFPAIRDVLPPAGSPTFGLAASGFIAVLLLPLLAVFDVTRHLAGERLCRLRALADGRAVAAPAAVVVTGAPATVLNGPEAKGTFAAGARRPGRRPAAD